MQLRRLRFAGHVDLSGLRPEGRAKALGALKALDRLQTTFNWTMGLFGLAAQPRLARAAKH
jgi:hypothetical protein